jgi:hypothetical protein
MLQVGFYEPYTFKSKTFRRRRCQLERAACQVRADHQSIRMGQIEAHLPRATPDLQDPRIARNRMVKQTRKFTALGPRPQRRQTVARRITWERRLFIEMAHQVGPRVAR